MITNKNNDMETQKGFILSKLVYIIVAVFIILVGMLLSRHTEEDSIMYPFKILGDTVEYYAAPTPEAKVKLRLGRLEEINTVIRKARLKNDAKKAEGKTEEFKKNVEAIKKDIDDIKQKGQDVADLELELEAITGINNCATASG